MSASSSTTRISAAMDGPRRRILRLRPDARIDLLAEDQTDRGAAALAVAQGQQSAVVLHDLLDDGEAQARAAGPRGHVGFGEALASLDRQAPPIVADDDRHIFGAFGHPDLNPTAVATSIVAGKAPIDGLTGILQQVGQRLADLPAITDQRHRMAREFRDELDIRIAGPLQEN